MDDLKRDWKHFYGYGFYLGMIHMALIIIMSTSNMVEQMDIENFGMDKFKEFMAMLNVEVEGIKKAIHPTLASRIKGLVYEAAENGIYLARQNLNLLDEDNIFYTYNISVYIKLEEPPAIKIELLKAILTKYWDIIKMFPRRAYTLKF